MRATWLGARVALAVACTATSFGCAVSKVGGAPSSPGAATAPSQPAAYGQAGYPSGAGAQPDQPSPYAQPPPPPAPQPGMAPPLSATPVQPGGGAGGATSRSMAFQSASNEIESSQRELDVAAGDCRNACRALGSMDRAAGKVCELTQGTEEGRRCDGAKHRVYSARDRVKTTCGSCPGGPSVERTAPIPSLR